MKRFARSLSLAILYAASLVGAIGGEAETGTKSSTKEQTLQFLHDLLPVAWQKRPMQRFNVFTEMTEEGRKQRLPSPAQPMYYYSPPGRFVQLGEVVGGEKPPPTAELEAAIRKELAANGYLPIANDQQRPDLLILLTFGSTGSHVIDGAMTAGEVVTEILGSSDSRELLRGLIERARLVAGDRFAADLLVAIKEAALIGDVFFPPFQMSMKSYDPKVIDRFIDIAAHSCYFVTATAFDFRGVEKKQKIPLWQTRMTIEAQGVSMEEILRPLILNTGAALGRETPEPRQITKRLEREGRVEVGTPTVIEPMKPGVVPDQSVQP